MADPALRFTLDELLAMMADGSQETIISSGAVGASRETGVRADRTEFSFFDDEELEQLPDPEPLIESVLFANTLAVLVGPHSSYKSFLALDFALSISTGMDWQGHRVQHGPVLYICAEGRSGIKKRIRAWKLARGWARRTGLIVLPQRVALSSEREAEALAAEIARRGINPVAIVVDTVSRNMAGNENTAEDMSKFVSGCDILRERLSATILGVHHTGWTNQDRSRGSTVLPASADTEMQVRRTGDQLTLSCTKQKDWPEFAAITLQAVPSAESLVLVSVEPGAGEMSANVRCCLTVLRENFTNGEATFTAWHEATALPKSSFSNALNALRLAGRVRQRGKLYSVIEPDEGALSPRSNTGPNEVQSQSGEKVQHPHPLNGDVLDQPQRGQGNMTLFSRAYEASIGTCPDWIARAR